MKNKAILTFLCGKMGSGKSTKSKYLAEEKNAVMISEDIWLTILYPDKINSFDDYIEYSTLMRPLIKLHVQDILKTGTNVVMDFPANTIKQRKWFLKLCSEIEVSHELIFLDISNEKCLKQLLKRNIEQPERSKFDNEDMFNYVNKFFEIPSHEEGLNLLHFS